MDTFGELVKAVKEFLNHNVARESRRLDKLIELSVLEKAVNTMEAAAQSEHLNNDQVLAAAKQLSEALATVGNFNRKGLREESGDLRQLIRLTEVMQSKTVRLIAYLGLLTNPAELGRLQQSLTAARSFFHRRLQAVYNLEHFRF